MQATTLRPILISLLGEGGGVASTSEDPWWPNGIVLVAEAGGTGGGRRRAARLGRPLVPAEVSDVLGVPVVAQVPAEAAVAGASSTPAFWLEGGLGDVWVDR